MTGDNNQSIPVRLHDKNRPCFQRGQTNSFVIGYPHSVGDLSYVQIWHNNGGNVKPATVNSVYARTISCPTIKAQLMLLFYLLTIFVGEVVTGVFCECSNI